MSRQLDLEYEPNLLLTVETLASDHAIYRLVNLGRHPVWIIKVVSTAAGGNTMLLRTGASLGPRGQHGLLPGEAVEVEPFPPVYEKVADEHGNSVRSVTNKATETDVTVTFHYGSTGPLEHGIVWSIARTKDRPGFAMVHYKGEPPPFPIGAIRPL